MKKKLYVLISSLIGAAGTAACAIVAYIQPEWCSAIIASIGIGTTAVNEILLLFVKDK